MVNPARRSLPLFVFSASGNTHYISQLVQQGFNRHAHHLSLRLIPLRSLSEFAFPPHSKDPSLMGLAFPIHEFMFPRLLLKWVQQLPAHRGHHPFYVFLIDTSGGLPCNAADEMCGILKTKNYTPIGVLEVPTPTSEPFFRNLYYPAGWHPRLLSKAYYFGVALAHRIKTGTHSFLNLKTSFFRLAWLTRWALRNFTADLPTIGSTIQIDHSKCTLCGQCLRVCPMEILDVHKGQIEKNHALCMGCGLCVRVCPQNAWQITYRGLQNWKILPATPDSRPGYIPPSLFTPASRPTFSRSLLYLSWLMIRAFRLKNH